MNTYKTNNVSKNSLVESTDRDVFNCTSGQCYSRAMFRVLNNNYCREHYDNYYHSIALKWNADNGLDTVEKRKNFISKNIRTTISKLKGV